MSRGFTPGLPQGYPSGSGPQKRGDPPFCQKIYDCGAGVSETATQPSLQTWIFDLDGPDSIQDLNSNIRIHQIEVSRVWFRLPGNATVPTEGTLLLTIDTITESNYNTATTKFRTDHTLATPASAVGDSGGQLSPSAMQKAIAVMSLGNVTPGDIVQWKNDNHIKHALVGNSRGVSQIRFRLIRPDGSIYTQVGGAGDAGLEVGDRIYVEMFIWGELSIQ